MVSRPYLIQRATIHKPLAPPSVRLSIAVDLDYMGSAEFEFGALPKSFRKIEAMAKDFVGRPVPEITKDGNPLIVYSYLNAANFAEYKTWLLRLNGEGEPVRTKESTRFERDYKSTYNKTDFWWDINNDAMFGFDPEFMRFLPEYVSSSLRYMNEQKAKG